MAVGRIRPNEASARAHMNQEASDWIPPARVNVGPGPHPDHTSPQTMAEPTELADGRWFVKDIASWQFAGDNESRKNARRSDTITPADVRVPPGQAKSAQAAPAESGIVERPGKAKARDVG